MVENVQERQYQHMVDLSIDCVIVIGGRIADIVAVVFVPFTVVVVVTVVSVSMFSLFGLVGMK